MEVSEEARPTEGGPGDRDLIRRMCRENLTWGAPLILSELLLLGHEVAESTVDKYMIRQPKPPSQNWRTFLENHVGQIAAADFFTVPTITFRVLYVFLVLRHDRRRSFTSNVTSHPTAHWAAQQIVEAFPFEEKRRFMLRDRDGIYGPQFRDRVEHMGMTKCSSPSGLRGKALMSSDWSAQFVASA